MDDEGNIVLRLYGVDKSVVTTTILMIDWIVAVADNESGGGSVISLLFFILFILRALLCCAFPVCFACCFVCCQKIFFLHLLFYSYVQVTSLTRANLYVIFPHFFLFTRRQKEKEKKEDLKKINK